MELFDGMLKWLTVLNRKLNHFLEDWVMTNFNDVFGVSLINLVSLKWKVECLVVLNESVSVPYQFVLVFVEQSLENNQYLVYFLTDDLFVKDE